MMFHKRLSMAKSSEHAAGPFMASAYRIRQFVQEKSIGSFLLVVLYLGVFDLLNLHQRHFCLSVDVLSVTE